MSKQAAMFQSLEQQQQKIVDLMENNDYLQAFSVLQSTIQSKRQKQNYPILEDLGRRILDCAFELSSFSSLKQVLTHLRNVCQHQSPDTIKKVFQYFRGKLSNLSENKLKDGDFDHLQDIERDKIPQQIISMSFNFTQSKSEASPADFGKMILQGYKIILDILRNNTQMIESYNITAVQALEFCLVHKRCAQFKRLSDLLRSHLQVIVENEKKTADQLRNVPHPMRLTDTQTTQFVLDLRQKQLQVAMRLKLTKDAYNVIQDVNFLLTRIGKKLEKRKLREYLGMVGRVFLDAGYHLYFAEAVMQQLHITLVKDLSASDQQKRIAAELAVVATLAIQRKNEANSFQKIGFISNKSLEYQFAEASYKKNSGLISSQRQPTRSGLLRDIVNQHVLSLCGEQIRQLFNLLHNQMIKPAQISQFAPSIISYLSKNELTLYLVHAIQNQLTLQILTILSKSYSSIHLKTIRKLTNFLSFDQTLHVISKANRQALLLCNIELNFKKEAVYFRSQKKKATSSNTNQFIDFLTKIQSTRALIDKRQYAGISEDSRKRAIKKAAENIEQDKDAIKQAKIKKRKEGQQHEQHVKSMNEQIQKNKKQIQQQEALVLQEEKRIETQMAHLKKLMMIKEEIKKNQKVECIKELKARGTKFNEDADMDVLLEELQKIEDKEKQHLKNAALKLFKHTHYFEIARRKAEKKKLEAQIVQSQKGRRQKIMQHFEKKHEVDLQMKKKYQAFKLYKRQHFKKVDLVREEEYKRRKEKYNAQLIEKVKIAVMQKAQEAKDKIDTRKRIQQAEKKRQAALKEAQQAMAAKNSEKPSKRAGFGIGIREVAARDSNNQGFKKGTGIKTQNLESFGFGQQFSFMNSSKKTDDSWKKKGAAGAKQLHKPERATPQNTVQKKVVKQSLDLPPPREDPNLKFDSKLLEKKPQQHAKKPQGQGIDINVFQNFRLQFKGAQKEDRKDPVKAKAQIAAAKEVRKEAPPRTGKPPSRPSATSQKLPPYQDHKRKKAMANSDSDSDDKADVDDDGFTIVKSDKKRIK